MTHQVLVLHLRLLPQTHIDHHIEKKPASKIPEPLHRDEVEPKVNRVGGISHDVSDLTKKYFPVSLNTWPIRHDASWEVGDEEETLRESEHEEDHRGDHQHQADHGLSALLFSHLNHLPLHLVSRVGGQHQNTTVSTCPEQSFDDEHIENYCDDEGDDQVEDWSDDCCPGVCPECSVGAPREAVVRDGCRVSHEEASGCVGDEQEKTGGRGDGVVARSCQELRLLQRVADRDKPGE